MEQSFSLKKELQGNIKDHFLEMKKPNSLTSINPERKENTADPFQILATQFNAEYDIYIFGDAIIEYMGWCLKEKLVPVIELRMYDGMSEENAEKYIKEAKELIKKKVGHNSFDLTISWLRDEVKKPVDGDGKKSKEMNEEFIAIVKSFTNFYKDGIEEGHREIVLQYLEQEGIVNSDKFKKSVDELLELGDPLDLLSKGDIMLPIPEAYDLYEDTNENLVKTICKGSIHEKVVAFLILTGRTLGLKIVNSNFLIDDKPTGRPRSNSMTGPEEVAVANLVMGDEEESANLVNSVVYNAFRKKAKVVHLVVEEKGMGKSKLKRIDRQIKILEEEGFEIVKKKKIEAYKPSKDQPAAQQSGIKKEEPLNHGKTRDRWLLVITKGSAIVHPLTFFEWKKFKYYYDDNLDDIYREEYDEYLNHKLMYFKIK